MRREVWCFHYTDHDAGLGWTLQGRSSGRGRIIQIPAGAASLGEYSSLIHGQPCDFYLCVS